MTPEEVALIAASISALSGLVGAVIGGAVSYAITKRQIRVTIIGSSRKAWIDSLRTAAADYAAVTSLLATHIEAGTGLLNKDKFAEQIVQLASVQSRMVMLLTLGNPDHDAVVNQAEILYGVVAKKQEDRLDRVRAERNKFIGVVQTVLRLELAAFQQQVK